MERSRFTLYLSLVILLGSVFLVYNLDFIAYWNEIRTMDWADYVLIVPVISLYLIYRKRRILGEVLALPREGISSDVAGLGTCALAFFVYFYGSFTPFMLFCHMVSLVLFIIGGVFLIYGYRMFRVLMFPLLFLILMAPPPIEILFFTGSTLTEVTSTLSLALVNLMRIPISLDMSSGTPVISCPAPGGGVFDFSMGVPCSGIYSLAGFLVFAVFLAYILNGPRWKKLATSVLGLVLIYFLNVLRVTSVILIGHFISPDIALQTFHMVGGLVLFPLGVLIALFLAERLLGSKAFQPALVKENCPSCNSSLSLGEKFCSSCGRLLTGIKSVSVKKILTRTMLLFLIALLMMSVSLPIFSMGNEQASIAVASPSGSQVEALIPKIDRWESNYVARLIDYEKITQEDLVLLYSYTDQTNSPPLVVQVILEITSNAYAHGVVGWLWCSRKVGWELKRYSPMVLSQELALVGWDIVLRNPSTGANMAVLCWTEQIYVKTASGIQRKLLGVSLVTYPNSPQGADSSNNADDYDGMFQVLSFLGGQIVNHWQQAYVSPIIIFTFYQFLVLNWYWVLVIVVVVTLTAFFVLSIRKARRILLVTRLTSYLKDGDRRLVNTILMAKSKGKITTVDNLIDCYREIPGNQRTDAVLLCKRLENLEAYGVVSREYKVVGDQVKVTWNTPLKVIHAPLSAK